MKKIVNVILLVIFFTGIVIINSCDKNEEGDNCITLASEFSKASQAYTYDITNTEKCKAFKTAANNYLSGCGDLSTSQRQDILEQYEQLDCN